MTYTPQPGTIPHRVVEHLRELADLFPRREPSTAEMCEALDIDSAGVTAFMRPAREHGLVHCRKKQATGKLLFWRMGDGTPDPLLGGRDMDSALIQPSAADASDHLNGDARPGEVLPGVAGTAPLRQEFRALIWEGQLLATGMEIIDGVAVFTPDQIDQVKRVVTWARQGVAA